ncbi:MAG: adenylate kinase [Synergistaceae bacterium]|jgi:adenylate kinase|nr:adenylate kinase [Synergistaceae bacterium]
MKIILIGPPGAGKGTQAAAIREIYPAAHISTGDLLRDNVRRGTVPGLEARRYMDSGSLAPDDLIINMMKDRLAEDDARIGFILDGFPRTTAQAEALDAILSSMQTGLDAVLMLDISDEDVVRRLSGRRVCVSCGAIYNTVNRSPEKEGVCDSCGGAVIQRNDDHEPVIRRRLAVYHADTAPLTAYYDKKGLLRRIGASEAPDAALLFLETLKGAI